MSLIGRRQLLIGSAAFAAVMSGARAAPSFAAKPAPHGAAFMSAGDAARLIRRGVITSAALVEGVLERVGRFEPRINALITTTESSARAASAELDAEAKAGSFRGPLHGVPFLLKDNIDTANIRTTAGSAVFDDRVPDADAPVVSRLKAAGAILLGKANMHEFAGGSTSASSYFGPTRNPWALSRDAGGSSGGSAAAVAAGFAPIALGTDTGGSIRMPAAYCGVVGLKPTYGLVPIRGIVPLVPSFDHCGPITRTVADAALVLQCIAGYDPEDIFSVDHEAEDYGAALNRPVAAFRVGVAREPFFDQLDGDTARAVGDAVAMLGKITRMAGPVRISDTSGFGDLAAAEILAYHLPLFRRQKRDYQLHFRQVLERDLTEANDITDRSPAEKLAAHVQDNRRLAELRRSADATFEQCDLIVLPTMRKVSGELEPILQREGRDQPANPRYVSNCMPFNLLGLPAISIPCGFSVDGLPIGLMIVGPRFGEAKVLALAAAYERETEWHLRRPALR